MNGSTITVTANEDGTASNYSLSGSIPNWNKYFKSPSFNITLSGSTLTGGSNGSLGSNPLVTIYGYDILNNLLSVQQQGGAGSSQWRNRAFQYDSLSRLTSATNPESGTIQYSYDANGNLSSKIAPLPNQTGSASVTTSYLYDADDRLLSKSYNDSYTAPVQYGYDAVAPTGCTPPSASDSYPIGRATSMCDGSGQTSWTHDKMGRVLQESRNIGSSSVNHQVTYTYNLDGSLATLVTPPMKQLNYIYNDAGRPTSLLDGTDQINFATSATYAPPGELMGMTLGSSSTFSGFAVSNAYNMRLQPILLSATNSSTGAAVFSECFDFHLRVAISSPSPCSLPASTVGNNGNVYEIVNNRSSVRGQNFTYDPLNRILSGNSTGTSSNDSYSWGDNYVIDAWGNLTNMNPIAGYTLGQNMQSGTALTNNQLSGYCYDAAGNLLLNSPCPQPLVNLTYVYDAENRIVWTSGGSGYRYMYDGHGERVEKCQVGSVSTACPTSGTTGKLYWKGTGSDTLAETDLGGNQQEEYLFFNGQRIARRDVTSTGTTVAVHYYFSDHLGTHGVVESSTGACEQDIDYYPYGGVEHDYCPNVSQNYKFTGKERDPESGLDEFGARHYASSLGRFVSVDPAFESEIIDLPQTWNRYSYVYNRPTFATDPDGRCPPCIGAIVGAVVEGGWNLGTQLYNNGGNLSDVKWKDVGANALGGAVAGGIAGATGGASLLVDAGVGSLANVSGGIVTRLAEGEDVSLDDVEEDAVAGFVAGGVGHMAGKLIHVPEEPELPARRRHAVGRRQLAKYDAAVAARNQAEMWHTGVHTGIHEIYGKAAIQNFWDIFDLIHLIAPPPPPPPPTPDVRTKIINCTDMQGNPCQS